MRQQPVDRASSLSNLDSSRGRYGLRRACRHVHIYGLRHVCRHTSLLSQQAHVTSRPHERRLFSEIGIQGPPLKWVFEMAYHCAVKPSLNVRWAGAERRRQGWGHPIGPAHAAQGLPCGPRSPPARSGCKSLFSVGGEATKFHIAGSLTIPKPGIKRLSLWEP